MIAYLFPNDSILTTLSSGSACCFLSFISPPPLLLLLRLVLFRLRLELPSIVLLSLESFPSELVLSDSLLSKLKNPRWPRPTLADSAEWTLGAEAGAEAAEEEVRRRMELRKEPLRLYGSRSPKSKEIYEAKSFFLMFVFFTWFFWCFLPPSSWHLAPISSFSSDLFRLLLLRPRSTLPPLTGTEGTRIHARLFDYDPSLRCEREGSGQSLRQQKDYSLSVGCWIICEKIGELTVARERAGAAAGIVSARKQKKKKSLFIKKIDCRQLQRILDEITFTIFCFLFRKTRK